MDLSPQTRLGRRVRRFVRLAAAGFVLFTIAADIVADTRCNKPSRSPSGLSLQEATSANSQDPCDAGCVPDCFCCSTLSASPAAPAMTLSGPAVPLEVLATLEFQLGVYPLPYRPPLARLS